MVRAKESRKARGVAEGVDPKYRVHTSTTMDRRIKPAAAASLAPFFEYTSELTDEVTSTMPPAVYPVIAT